MEESFIALLERSIRKNWHLDALTDYHTSTLQYKDVARKIEKVHIIFEEIGLKKGDKVAICGRNSSAWGATFLAILTYGAVAVPILHEFKADNIHHIVNHSDAKLLFVGDRVWELIEESAMPAVKGILLINDYSLLVSRSKGLTYAREHLNELFGKKYPMKFRPEHVDYHRDSPEELAVINYTSGTTSASKGVMLPYRSLNSNVQYALDNMPLAPGEKTMSILPLAHTFGMSFELLFPIASGCHVHTLARVPSPKIVVQAYNEIKPSLIFFVPLVLEKIIKKNVLPKLQTPMAQLMLKMPFVSGKIKERICKQVSQVFGSRFNEVVLGGAPLNKDVEAFLKMIQFRYTVGYGMTECGPLLAYDPWRIYKAGTCGKAVDRVKLKIDSPDPERIVGEILCKGDNVMLGYYKNEEATRRVMTGDGWMRTGDLGTIDANGVLTIRGRSKDMILGTNGQNIYPEEIEGLVNNLQYVAESIVIQKDSKLVALVYPDYEAANACGMNDHDKIAQAIDEQLPLLNQKLPNYCQISAFKMYHEEFEKTPKKSIKRYLYRNG